MFPHGSKNSGHVTISNRNGMPIPEAKRTPLGLIATEVYAAKRGWGPPPWRVIRFSVVQPVLHSFWFWGECHCQCLHQWHGGHGFCACSLLGILASNDQASNKCGSCLWAQCIAFDSIRKPRAGSFIPPSYGYDLGTLDSLLIPNWRKLEIAMLRWSRRAARPTASFWSSFESPEVTGR